MVCDIISFESIQTVIICLLNKRASCTQEGFARATAWVIWSSGIEVTKGWYAKGIRSCERPIVTVSQWSIHLRMTYEHHRNISCRSLLAIAVRPVHLLLRCDGREKRNYGREWRQPHSFRRSRHLAEEKNGRHCPWVRQFIGIGRGANPECHRFEYPSFCTSNPSPEW